MTATVLEKALAEVDTIVADLDAALPRLTLTANYGERTSTGSKTAPVPVNVAVLDAKHALHKWLMGAALRLGEPFTARTPQAIASHLLYHHGAIQEAGWAEGAGRELRGLLNQCENVTNQAQHREFAGTCTTEDCGTELWVTIGGDDTTCKTCGATYTAVQEWRNGARDYARKSEEDILGYPQKLAERLAAVHGEDIGADYIRVLASRGILQRANPTHGPDGKKLRALYRLGDIKDILNHGKKEGAA